MTTAPSDAPSQASPSDPMELPDLRSLIVSDEAQEAAAALLDAHRDSGGASHVGSLTDEELAVCFGTVDGAQPVGRWYAGLSENSQLVSRVSAYRSLTSREEVLVTMREDGVDVRVSQRLLGLLRLRMNPPVMTAQGMTRQGPAWYVVRRCEDAWLREVVTGHGIHTHDLIALDDDEELFLRGFTALLDRNTPSDVNGLRQPGRGAQTPGDVVSFLTRQRNVTQVLFVDPDVEQPEALVLCVDDSGATTLGRADGDDVVYHGSDPEVFLERWRSWRERW